MEALKEKKGSSEDKKKVVEMLRKMQESELDGQDGQEMGSVNGEEEMDMHERFAGMDLSELVLYTSLLSSRDNLYFKNECTFIV